MTFRSPLEEEAKPLETILASAQTEGLIFLLDGHHERLVRTARAFGFACASLAELRQSVLASIAVDPEHLGAHRVRVIAQRNGSLVTSATPLPMPHAGFPDPDPAATPLLVVLDRVRVEMSCAEQLHFKTTSRRLYDEARARVGCAPASSVRGDSPFDVILANACDEITEAGIANIAIELMPSEAWLTPPLRCGLVDGVMRRELLRSGRLVEAVVTVAQLLSAARARSLAVNPGTWYPRIFCMNAVRGVYEVVVREADDY